MPHDGDPIPTRHPLARAGEVVDRGSSSGLACAGAAIEATKLILGLIQARSLRLRELYPGTVHIEGQHRHRRAVRVAFPTAAALGGPLERSSNARGFVNTPPSRSRALLRWVTFCDHCLRARFRGRAIRRGAISEGSRTVASCLHIERQKARRAAVIRKPKSGQYPLYSRNKNPKKGERRNLGAFRPLRAARQR